MTSNQKVLRVKQFVVKKEVGLNSLYRTQIKMAHAMVFGIGRKGNVERVQSKDEISPGSITTHTTAWLTECGPRPHNLRWSSHLHAPKPSLDSKTQQCLQPHCTLGLQQTALPLCCQVRAAGKSEALTLDMCREGSSARNRGLEG